LDGVFVIGSVNQDFVLRVECRPRYGLNGHRHPALFPGGKGVYGIVTVVLWTCTRKAGR
jgi:hypothetical protein